MTDESKATETIEIVEPEIVTKEETTAPSRDELKENGWSAEEMEKAEKRGMIPKKEEKKTGDKPAEKPIDRRNGSALPDFTFKTPEQEKAFLEAFGPGTGQRAMYFRMKNERQARQAAEQKARDLETRLAALETPKPKVTPEVDENGNEIDPDDKPLTMRQIKEMQKKEAEENQRQQRELGERSNRVADALKAQEEFAKEIVPDFAEQIDLAKEVMNNMDDLFTEKWRKDRVIELIKDLQVKAANADQFDIDAWNAPMISLEIAKMHPNYGKPSNGTKAETHDNGESKDPKKANGSHTPEQMKRIEANTQRRASSASIPGGGGRRSISVDDVSELDLAKMSANERQKFKEKHPDRYAKLLRG